MTGPPPTYPPCLWFNSAPPSAIDRYVRRRLAKHRRSRRRYCAVALLLACADFQGKTPLSRLAYLAAGGSGSLSKFSKTLANPQNFLLSFRKQPARQTSAIGKAEFPPFFVSRVSLFCRLLQCVNPNSEFSKLKFPSKNTRQPSKTLFFLSARNRKANQRHPQP